MSHEVQAESFQKQTNWSLARNRNLGPLTSETFGFTPGERVDRRYREPMTHSQTESPTCLARHAGAEEVLLEIVLDCRCLDGMSPPNS